MNRRQTILWIFLGFIGVAMLAGLIAIILPQRFINDQVMATIMTVGIYALGGLIVMAIGREMRLTRAITIGALLVSMLSFLTVIWFERMMRGKLEESFYQAAFATLVISLMGMHRLLIVPLEERNAWGHASKRVAMISSGISGLMIIGFLLFEGLWGWNDIMSRIMGVGLLLTSGSSIAAGAIAIFGPRPGEDEPDVVSESIELQLCCPVCRNQLQVHSNRDGHCGHCKLQIRVNTSELRCGCGYLLHQLERDICPECGKAVEAGKRWGDVSPA